MLYYSQHGPIVWKLPLPKTGSGLRMLNSFTPVKDLQVRMENDLKPMTDCDNFDIRVCLRT